MNYLVSVGRRVRWERDASAIRPKPPNNGHLSYLVGTFLQAILFFRLDKRRVPYRTASGAPGVLRRVREAYPRLALSHHSDPGLSGLAQVTGGYDLLPKEKVVLDL